MATSCYILLCVTLICLENYLCKEIVPDTGSSDLKTENLLIKRGVPFKRLPGWSVYYGKRSGAGSSDTSPSSDYLKNQNGSDKNGGNKYDNNPSVALQGLYPSFSHLQSYNVDDKSSEIRPVGSLLSGYDKMDDNVFDNIDLGEENLTEHGDEIDLNDLIRNENSYSINDSRYIDESTPLDDDDIQKLGQTNLHDRGSDIPSLPYKRSSAWQAFYGKRDADLKGDSSKRTSEWQAVYGKRAPAWSATYGKRAPAWNAIYGKRAPAWSATYGKRAPAWSATYGKRAHWGVMYGKRAPAWSATYGKRAPAWNVVYGKRAPAWSAIYGKRPAWSATYGKRAPAWNAIYGKRAPAWNAIYGKRAPAWSATYGKRAPAWGVTYGKRAPAWRATYGKRAPAWGVTYGKRNEDLEPFYGQDDQDIVMINKRSVPWGVTYGKRPALWGATYGKKAAMGVTYDKRAPWSATYGKRIPAWQSTYGKRDFDFVDDTNTLVDEINENKNTLSSEQFESSQTSRTH